MHSQHRESICACLHIDFFADLCLTWPSANFRLVSLVELVICRTCYLRLVTALDQIWTQLCVTERRAHSSHFQVYDRSIGTFGGIPTRFASHTVSSPESLNVAECHLDQDRQSTWGAADTHWMSRSRHPQSSEVHATQTWTNHGVACAANAFVGIGHQHSQRTLTI